MKTLMKILLTLVAICLAQSCVSPGDAGMGKWEDRIAQVRVGMERGEVERLLPLFAPHGEAGTGGSKCISYWVDEHWMVGVQYDHHMTLEERNARQPDAGTYSLHNRVVSAPVLTRKDCPAKGPAIGFQMRD